MYLLGPLSRAMAMGSATAHQRLACSESTMNSKGRKWAWINWPDVERTGVDDNPGREQGRPKTDRRRSTLAGLTRIGSSWVEATAAGRKKVKWTTFKKRKAEEEQQQTLKRSCARFSLLSCRLYGTCVLRNSPMCTFLPVSSPSEWICADERTDRLRRAFE